MLKRFFDRVARSADAGTGTGDPSSATTTTPAAGTTTVAPAGGGDAAAAAAAAAAATTPPSWYAGLALSDDVKAYVDGKKYPDLATALESGMNADRVARSRNLLDRPDPEKLSDWKHWSDLGWVEDVAKYTFKPPEGIDQGLIDDFGMVDAVRSAAHGAKIPLAQAQAVYHSLMTHMDGRLKEMEQAGASSQTAMQTALRAEWGADYAKNEDLAKRAVRTFAIEKGVLSDLEQVMGSANLVKLFHTIGTKMGEASFVDANGGDAGGALVGDAARTERKRMEADPKVREALQDPRHPRYQEVTDTRNRLLEAEAKAQR